MSGTQVYVVTGIHTVLGHQPGTEFTAALSPEQERTLVQGGAITRVGGTVDRFEKARAVSSHAKSRALVTEPKQDDDA